MEHNENYVNDALVSGSFQLVKVNDLGEYDPETSLTYFIYSGAVEQKSDADKREQITAQYNAEKARINEDEDWIDMQIQDDSTELEVTKTELESLKSMLQDDMKPFEIFT
jgi:ATPase subunit of ABC transporter with duplicated ATPase domains